MVNVCNQLHYVLAFPTDELKSEDLQFMEDHGYLDFLVLGVLSAVIMNDQTLLMEIMTNFQEASAESGMSEKQLIALDEDLYNRIQSMMHVLVDFYKTLTDQMTIAYREDGMTPIDAKVDVDRQVVLLTLEA